MRKFNVSYQSVILIEAKDADDAVQKVVDLAFELAEASMPIVLDVELLAGQEDDDDDEDDAA
jgi:hypothetical protein